MYVVQCVEWNPLFLNLETWSSTASRCQRQGNFTQSRVSTFNITANLREETDCRLSLYRNISLNSTIHTLYLLYLTCLVSLPCTKHNTPESSIHQQHKSSTDAPNLKQPVDSHAHSPRFDEPEASIPVALAIPNSKDSLHSTLFHTNMLEASDSVGHTSTFIRVIIGQFYVFRDHPCWQCIWSIEADVQHLVP